MIEIAIGLQIDADKFERDIKEMMGKKFFTVLTKSRERVSSAIKVMLHKAIWASPEAASLQGGPLQAELGVENPIAAINQVVNAVLRSVEVIVGPTGLTIRALPVDLNDVLSIPLASFRSENGFIVSWLEWLLTAGDTVVVQQYHFVEGSFQSSRTGLGIMRRGGVWHVPEHQGTYQDNWLTRAFDNLRPEIVKILNSEIK